MKVLIVGGGGREHALAWKLERDDPRIELISAPGNAGIAELGRRVLVSPSDVSTIAALAEHEKIDLTVVGPEAPIAEGLVDELRKRRLAVFGPTRAAAEIETSKRFAKSLMLEHGIPTAMASAHTDPKAAKRAASDLGPPVVIKASGLAAGKGVMVCASMKEADRAIDRMLGERIFGEAGFEILVEEFMEGEELSIFAITDGIDAIPLMPVQDHKRLLEGDAGPNTGGMGSYAPVSIGTPELVERVRSTIFEPTLAALRAQGRLFAGLIYAGLMMTDAGPKVVEFNCRFGDPETEALLPLMRSSLLELLWAVANGAGLSGSRSLDWVPGYAVTTVVAAPGYPEKPRTGAPIGLPQADESVMLFHAGTERAPDGTLVSSGGRVLAVTAVGNTMEEAQSRSRSTAEAVQLDGRQLRRDIGWRELKRGAGAT